MGSKLKGFKKVVLSFCLILALAFTVFPSFAKTIYAAGGYSYQIGSSSVTVINDSTDQAVYTCTGLTCSNWEDKRADYERVVSSDPGPYSTMINGINAWSNTYCVCQWTFADDLAPIGTVHGLSYNRIRKDGIDMFCLDSTKAFYKYNCENGGSWSYATFTPSGLGWDEDTFIDIAKIVSLYNGGNYKDVQNSIWARLGQPTDSGFTNLISQARNLNNGNFTKHIVSMSGTPSGTLGSSFTMTDSNGEFSSSKFSVGSTSSGITVVKNGNSTINTITQPYPITKTVNINGGSTESHGARSASISGYRAGRADAQSFANLSDFADDIKVDEYPGTSYSVTFPTGRISFQKKDTNGNNVTSNYCQTSGLCEITSADPTANYFRLLIDNTSQYWGTNADTGTAVVVNGVTYHVFQLENGTTSFKTDNNGQINLSNVLVGKYYLQETSVDERVFVVNTEDLTEFNVTNGATASASFNNENLGYIEFQKKDSFENNVYKDYCKDTHLCIIETADATNNHFRILIDEDSKYWNGYNDTQEEVTVEEKTYHVYQTPNKVKEFVTDAVGKMRIYLPQGHFYIQETSVDENVFIVNEELVEVDILPAQQTDSSMKNINLFGDFELQKWDEFGNSGILNTYNDDASGNSFKLKYVDTLGKDIFANKSFNLPNGTVAVNSDRYLEINGSSVFTTDSDGYFWICEDFTATKNLCVPFGNWMLEEIAVQNEYELNTKEGENPMAVEVEVGQKTHTDYTNDYREISIRLYKQDKADEIRVKGAKYDIWDIDQYNIGNPEKGAGDLYGEDADTEIYNSINKGDTVNFYDTFVGQQDGRFPDYNYVYNFETNGDDDKVADDKYLTLSDNAELLTAKSSGLTTVEVSKQLLDLYGTVQDRYYYIGDHSFDPYENLNLYLDEERQIVVNIRDKEYKIEKVGEVSNEKVISASAEMSFDQLNKIKDTTIEAKSTTYIDEQGQQQDGPTVTEISGPIIDKLDELGIDYEIKEEDNKIVLTLDNENYQDQINALNTFIAANMVDGEEVFEITPAVETETEYSETLEPIASLNDMWDVEGKYLITYTIVDEARHKWTFTRYVTYEDDHLQVCEYNAVIGEYVWGDTKEICKELDNDNPEVKRAPEEYDYDSRTITYDPDILLHLVEAEESAEYLGSFDIWSVDKTSKPEFDRADVDEVNHYYYLGEYETDDNGEALIDGLMHSRTYMVCEAGLPKGYTYDETENVCFIIEGNYNNGREIKVNTKNNEITEILIHTSAAYEDGEKTYEFDGESHTITDNVVMLGLDMSTDYILKTDLYSKLTGEVIDSKTTEFTSKNNLKKYILDVDFEITPTKNVDQDYVVFEYLYRADNPDEVVAIHEDINDEDQTVHVTKRVIEIKTTAMVEGAKSKEFDFAKTSVIDTVEYSNTFVGKESTMKASLIDLETNEVVATGEKVFTPDQLNGTVDVEIVFEQEANLDKRYVVFEELYLTFLGDKDAVAEHKDPSDENQIFEITKREFKMGTTVSNKDIHISKDNTIVEFTDKVEYENLMEGRTYKLLGYLIDKKTGNEVVINGKRVEGELVFKVEEKDGSVDVPFKFNAAIDRNNWLGDGDYVVYEELYVVEVEKDEQTGEDKIVSEKLVFEHKDINNLDQTFKFTDDYRYYRFMKKNSDNPDEPSVPDKPYRPVNTATEDLLSYRYAN